MVHGVNNPLDGVVIPGDTHVHTYVHAWKPFPHTGNVL